MITGDKNNRIIVSGGTDARSYSDNRLHIFLHEAVMPSTFLVAHIQAITNVVIF